MTALSTPRIRGWLLLPLAWLLITLLSSTLSVVLYFTMLLREDVRAALTSQTSEFLFQWGISVLTVLILWGYSAWLTWLFCKCSRRLPRHYIIWLLLTIAMALKTWAFSPVSDAVALRTLLMALLAAAILAPYFRRSQRVRATFIAP